MSLQMFIKRLPNMTEQDIKEAKILENDDASILQPSDLDKVYKEFKYGATDVDTDFINQKEEELEEPVEIKIEMENDDDEDDYKIVALDDSEIDYEAVRQHKEVSDQKIIVFQDGKIKQLTEEEMKNIKEILGQ